MRDARCKMQSTRCKVLQLANKRTYGFSWDCERDPLLECSIDGGIIGCFLGAAVGGDRVMCARRERGNEDLGAVRVSSCLVLDGGYFRICKPYKLHLGLVVSDVERGGREGERESWRGESGGDGKLGVSRDIDLDVKSS